MKKLIDLPKMLGLGMLLVGLTGCGDVVGDIQRGLEQAGKQFVFDSLVSQAESNDGTAKLVQPGEEFILEITEGPISGTKVVIPADGLPSGVTEAVLAAYHLKDFQLSSDSDYAFQGPAVQIQLQNLTTDSVGEAIELAEAATVYIPFTTEDDTIELSLGELEDTQTLSQNWKIHEEATQDEEESRLVTETTELPSKTPFPFAVLSDAPEEAVLVYSYSVSHETDGIVCSGEIADSVSAANAIENNNEDSHALDISGDGDSFSLSLVYEVGDNADEIPYSDITDASQVLTCGTDSFESTALPSEEDFTLTYSDWETTDESAETTCGDDSTPCTTLTGDATISFATTFVDGDNTVVVTLEGPVSGITWDAVVED